MAHRNLEEIGITELLRRLMFGETSDGRPCCLWCGFGTRTAGINGIASPADDATWSEIAADHAPECRWIETRAFTRRLESRVIVDVITATGAADPREGR